MFELTVDNRLQEQHRFPRETAADIEWLIGQEEL